LKEIGITSIAPSLQKLIVEAQVMKPMSRTRSQASGSLTSRICRILVANLLGMALLTAGVPTSSAASVAAHFAEPTAMTVSGNNLYVVNTSSNSVTQIDAASGDIKGEFGGTRLRMDSPVAIVVALSRVWVANFGNDSVTEWKVGSNSGNVLSGSKFGFSQPQSIIYEGGFLWVANLHSSTITIISATTLKARILDIGSDGCLSPTALEYSSGTVWATCSQSNSLLGLSSANLKVKSFVGGSGGRLFGPGPILQVGKNLWVANVASSSVSRFDVTGGTRARLSCEVRDGFATPESFAFSGTNIYVANMLGHSVAILPSIGCQQTGLRHLVSTFLREPDALGVIGSSLFVADAQAQDVVEFSTISLKVIRVIH